MYSKRYFICSALAEHEDLQHITSQEVALQTVLQGVWVSPRRYCFRRASSPQGGL